MNQPAKQKNMQTLQLIFTEAAAMAAHIAMHLQFLG